MAGRYEECPKGNEMFHMTQGEARKAANRVLPNPGKDWVIDGVDWAAKPYPPQWSFAIYGEQRNSETGNTL